MSMEAGFKLVGYQQQGGSNSAAPVRNASPTAEDSLTIAPGGPLYKLRRWLEPVIALSARLHCAPIFIILRRRVLTVQYFQVTENEDGQRLDNYLLSRLKAHRNRLVYRVIRKGEVRVNRAG